MKTILQICPRLHTGGIEQGTVDMAIAAKKAGYMSIVISGGGHLEAQLLSAGIRHITLPVYQKSPFAILRNAKLIERYIRRYAVDLVHARSRAPIWATYLALKKHPIPFITSCHSPHGLGPFSIKKPYNNPITYGDKVIAISEFIASYLKTNYQLAKNKITVIYRGIDTQRFNKQLINNDHLESLKKLWKIPDNALTLLIPGRITRWKGQDVFLQALAALKNHMPIFGLMIGRIDSDSYFDELKKIISEHQLDKHIKHVDDFHDMPYAYALADITISASRKAEAFGRVAVEAQAMESLVIATDLGAAKETVLPGKTGFLVQADNPATLAESIERVQRLSSEEKEQIKQTALMRCHELFSKQAMTRKTLSTYEKNLSKK